MKPVWGGGLPVLGRLPEVARDPLGTFTAAAACGPVVDLGTTWDPVVGTSRVRLVTEPALVERLMLDIGRFDKDYRVLAPVMGEGLFTSAGSVWREQRRQLQPAFARAAHAGFAEAMRAATRARVATWERGGTVDLAAEMSALTLDIVLRALFGGEARELEHEVSEGLRGSVPLLDARIWLPSWPDRVPTPANLRLRRAVARLDGVVARIVAQRRDSEPRPDLLGLLLETHGDPDDPAQARAVRDQIVTFLLAGHETTASALTWTCWCLDQHPDTLARARDEARSATGDLPDDLPFLSACFQEGTRLYPPVWAFARTATGDTLLGDWDVARGDALFVSPWLLHRLQDQHPDPEAFAPDRFLRDASWHPFAYLPFGGGPRTCIGARFAALEGTIVLAHMLRHATPRFLGTPTVLPRLTLYPSGDTRVRWVG
ncbi:MAG: cytochrome P450 [Alphaproteobacteria bacterium]|nr:cytochrome P450 [Alphaproteobacteria bacterium]